MSGIFEGIGTELTIFVLTLVVGAAGYGSYKFVTRNKSQQKSGKKSVQIMSGRDTNIKR